MDPFLSGNSFLKLILHKKVIPKEGIATTKESDDSR